MTTTDTVLVAGAGGALGSRILAHYLGEQRPVAALDRDLAHERVPPGDYPRISLELASGAVLDEALDRLEQEGMRFTLLVNLIGLIWNEPLLAFKGRKLVSHDINTWRNAIEANLTAPFILASRVAARMARQGSGAIINFSSVAASGHAGQAAYGAAKAGLEALTRVMAIEYGPLGVRTNAVALGFVDVESTRAALDETKLQSYAKATPIGRLGTTDDVIEAINFLATDTFVNGAVLRLDGGLRV